VEAADATMMLSVDAADATMKLVQEGALDVPPTIHPAGAGCISSTTAREARMRRFIGVHRMPEEYATSTGQATTGHPHRYCLEVEPMPWPRAARRIFLLALAFWAGTWGWLWMLDKLFAE
jgi:hypothetical protein